MRRWPVRLLRGVQLPDSIRSIRVARSAAKHARPEHEALQFLPAGLHDALVAHFAHEHRHFRRARQRARHSLHRVRNTRAVAVTRLEHVEVQHRLILHAVARCI